MPKCSEIIDFLGEVAPETLAEDFDNVGFLVGRKEKEVNRILLTLDVDEGVSEEAVEKECGLILSHHPVIFHPLREISDKTSQGRMLLNLIENKIAVYSAHTNLDAAWGGLNDFLLEKMEFSSNEVLQVGNDEVGIGRIVYLNNGITVKDLANKVKKAFSLSEIRYSGDGERIVHSIAICSGGGSGMIDDCLMRSCDAFITGDIKYTGARMLWGNGVSVIDLGHYESEHICMELFEKLLSEKFGKEIEFVYSEKNVNIFSSL